MDKKRPYKHPQFNLRIPEDLKQEIAKRADKNNRSINAEIISILKKEVDAEKYSNAYLELSKNELSPIIESYPGLEEFEKEYAEYAESKEFELNMEADSKVHDEVTEEEYALMEDIMKKSIALAALKHNRHLKKE